jgi:sucrose phosphorylase
VALTLPGIPAVYIHSLLGSGNWAAGVALTGRARTINREKLSAEKVAAELADPRSIRARVFQPYLNMIRVRIGQPAFHPGSGTQVHHLDDRVLTIQRTCPNQNLFALTNLSADRLTIRLPDTKTDATLTDLLSGRRFCAGSVSLSPYDVLWVDNRVEPALS